MEAMRTTRLRPIGHKRQFQMINNPIHDVSAGGRRPLQPGQVFACDIYGVWPKENLEVRVEDTLVITEAGCENLTPGLPRTIAEIEAFMKKK
jgi:Xaa-Pro aminopeptidase